MSTTQIAKNRKAVNTAPSARSPQTRGRKGLKGKIPATWTPKADRRLSKLIATGLSYEAMRMRLVGALGYPPTRVALYARAGVLRKRGLLARAGGRGASAKAPARVVAKAPARTVAKAPARLNFGGPGVTVSGPLTVGLPPVRATAVVLGGRTVTVEGAPQAVAETLRHLAE